MKKYLVFNPLRCLVFSKQKRTKPQLTDILTNILNTSLLNTLFNKQCSFAKALRRDGEQAIPGIG